eukprot:jgi/Tetstr1/447916/TSEL_035224.t1
MGRKVKQSEAQKDVFLDLAGQLRTKHGISWRHGIAQGDRVEFFRGKDFAAWLKEHPAEVEALGVEPLRPGRTVEAQVEEVHIQMARRQLYVRAERMYKKPKPGRKKLVKWPKKLVYNQDDQSWEPEAFYCWTFDRPTSPWLWLGSAALVLIVFGMCLFPLAPYSVKISVVYVSMALLGIIFGMLFVRAVVFAVVWVLLGRHFWLLPNVTSDELGIAESFSPLFEFSLEEDGSEVAAPHWAARLGMGLLCGASMYALHEYAPSHGSVKTGLGKAHDSILDFLNLHDPGMMKITDTASANVTAGEGSSEGDAAGGSASGDHAAGSEYGSGEAGGYDPVYEEGDGEPLRTEL